MSAGTVRQLHLCGFPKLRYSSLYAAGLRWSETASLDTVNEHEGGWDLVAERLGSEISHRGVSFRAIEQASGVSYRTLQKLLEGKPIKRRERLAALAHYFGWRADAWDRIRRGEEPLAAEEEHEPQSREDEAIAALRREMLREMAKLRQEVDELRGEAS